MEITENRIFLLGFMGCGKSYWGTQIANELGLKWIDLDEYIENKTSKTIKEIFEKEGETTFRKIEKEALEEMALFNNVVISLGGGTPCFFENMEFIKRSGISFYLKTDSKTLVHRLQSEKIKRPLLAQLSDAALFNFIENKVNKRSVFYEKAAFIINTEQADILFFIKKQLLKKV
ncbi:MAG: shikimate kinase [Saprospiraceae bacterium]